MPIFRRPKRAWVGTYEAPEAVEPPPMDSLVDEGALIVSSGVRLAVKNLAILSILRDGGRFALDWYREQVRDQLSAIATEKEADAARAAVDLRKSRNALHGGFRDRPEDGEIERLERRVEMLEGLVSHLRALCADDDYLVAIAFASRDAAWDEIGASVQSAAIARAAEPQALHGADRDIAMMTLGSDLADMLRTSTRPGGSPDR